MSAILEVDERGNLQLPTLISYVSRLPNAEGGVPRASRGEHASSVTGEQRNRRFGET
jgi:hypothetical protein